jgi:hypothetical protein
MLVEEEQPHQAVLPYFTSRSGYSTYYYHFIMTSHAELPVVVEQDHVLIHHRSISYAPRGRLACKMRAQEEGLVRKEGKPSSQILVW